MNPKSKTMEKESKVYVAGHRGLVGSAIMKALKTKGYRNILTRTHGELDLTRQDQVEAFFEEEKPEYVFLSAAKVGGIHANSTYPAEFIYQNMMIAANVIHASYNSGVKKLLNLGSSCIYPRECPQPIKEEYLLTGPLEVTNEAYALAKIAAIRLCKHYNQQYATNFISAMPTNLYGPGDNYHPENSHVLPAMIRKFHEAKVNGTDVTLWGDGSPFREFLFSEDLAEALLFLMENAEAKDLSEVVNVGTGRDISIKELAEKVAQVVGFHGKIHWDISKPNGTPKKLLSVEKIQALGWKERVLLDEGIAISYEDFLSNEYP